MNAYKNALFIEGTRADLIVEVERKTVEIERLRAERDELYSALSAIRNTDWTDDPEWARCYATEVCANLEANNLKTPPPAAAEMGDGKVRETDETTDG